MHCVDLGESFPTSIYLQKSASIQPRTSSSQFEGKFNSIFTRLLSPGAGRGGRRRPRACRSSGHRSPRPAVFVPGRTLSQTARAGPGDASALSKLNSWRLLKLIKIKSARSRLYRSQILQVITRGKALAEIYTMHSFALFSMLIFLFKNRRKCC